MFRRVAMKFFKTASVHKFASNLLGFTAFSTMSLYINASIANAIQADTQQQLSNGSINQEQANDQLEKLKNDFRTSLLCRK